MEKLFRKLKEIGLGRVAVLFLSGMALLLLTFSEGDNERRTVLPTVTPGPEENTPEYYEEKLQEILSQVLGVGEVQVMLAPDMSGIVVLAEGANDGEVVLEITNAAYVLFEIPAHKVRVLPYH